MFSMGKICFFHTVKKLNVENWIKLGETFISYYFVILRPKRIIFTTFEIRDIAKNIEHSGFCMLNYHFTPANMICF